MQFVVLFSVNVTPIQSPLHLGRLHGSKKWLDQENQSIKNLPTRLGVKTIKVWVCVSALRVKIVFKHRGIFC